MKLQLPAKTRSYGRHRFSSRGPVTSDGPALERENGTHRNAVDCGGPQPSMRLAANQQTNRASRAGAIIPPVLELGAMLAEQSLAAMTLDGPLHD